MEIQSDFPKMIDVLSDLSLKSLERIRALFLISYLWPLYSFILVSEKRFVRVKGSDDFFVEKQSMPSICGNFYSLWHSWSRFYAHNLRLVHYKPAFGKCSKSYSLSLNCKSELIIRILLIKLILIEKLGKIELIKEKKIAKWRICINN